MSEQENKESLLLYADRMAREMADKLYGPITLTPQPQYWTYIYWQTMQGYGYKPYYPGFSD